VYISDGNVDIENNLMVAVSDDVEPVTIRYNTSNVNSLQLSRKASNRYITTDAKDIEEQPVIVNNPSIRKVRKSILPRAGTGADVHNTDNSNDIGSSNMDNMTIADKNMRKINRRTNTQVPTESAILDNDDSTATEEVSFVSLRKVNKYRFMYLTSTRTTDDATANNGSIDGSATETCDQETDSEVSWNIQSNKRKGLFK